MIEHKEHAYIVNDPYNQEEINNALLDLYHNEKIQKKMCYSGQNLAKEFDWSVSGKKYNALIKSLVD